MLLAVVDFFVNRLILPEHQRCICSTMQSADFVPGRIARCSHSYTSVDRDRFASLAHTSTG